MAAADQDGVTSTTTWYEAYASGDEVERRVQQQEDDVYEYEDVEEVEEMEEMADDEPMRITGRLFLGSIDAARNVGALKRLRIGGVLALLGEGEEDAAVLSHSSAVDEQYAELQISRVSIEMEDSEDGDLLCKLPGVLATLRTLVETAEREDTNVLVHCIAGRSRSASIVAAWMLVTEPKRQSVQDVVDRIRIVRPWIEINPHFMQDLHLFNAVLASTDKTPLSANDAAVLRDRTFPRLDFGANLVDGIFRNSKTITMRLLSDVESDQNSGLGDIFPLSIVVATTASADDSLTRPRFAYLRIDQIKTQKLDSIDQATLRKSGFNSTDEVLEVLKEFYPNVTAATPLLMLHFCCLCPY